MLVHCSVDRVFQEAGIGKRETLKCLRQEGVIDVFEARGSQNKLNAKTHSHVDAHVTGNSECRSRSARIFSLHFHDCQCG